MVGSTAQYLLGCCHQMVLGASGSFSVFLTPTSSSSAAISQRLRVCPTAYHRILTPRPVIQYFWSRLLLPPQLLSYILVVQVETTGTNAGPTWGLQ